ncbi:MAG: Nif11-like leader peptide family RiPP precursor [Cyanobacteria bacterium]|nr:Nif11-like leader peptide family RiPP precursor [Cyanobacteriota bacterium]
MEVAPADPMSLQQLEAFLARVQEDPTLERPLATAPDAATVAEIAHAAGFAVTEEDLLAAAGEPPEVLEIIEILATPQDGPQAELDAFLQQVELDPDLQRVLASAPDAEAVAALARVAGFGVTAQDVWEASDEEPEALELVSYTVVIEATGSSYGGYGAAGGIAAGGIAGGGIAGGGIDGIAVDGAADDGADADGAAADALAAELGFEAAALDEPLPVALEAFLRQAEVDPDLQKALSTAADAAAVAEIARGSGFDVGEADLWGATHETPEALQEPQLDPPAASELADPWGVEETPAQKA